MQAARQINFADLLKAIDITQAPAGASAAASPAGGTPGSAPFDALKKVKLSALQDAVNAQSGPAQSDLNFKLDAMQAVVDMANGADARADELVAAYNGLLTELSAAIKALPASAAAPSTGDAAAGGAPAQQRPRVAAPATAAGGAAAPNAQAGASAAGAASTLGFRVAPSAGAAASATGGAGASSGGAAVAAAANAQAARLSLKDTNQYLDALNFLNEDFDSELNSIQTPSLKDSVAAALAAAKDAATAFINYVDSFSPARNYVDQLSEVEKQQAKQHFNAMKSQYEAFESALLAAQAQTAANAPASQGAQQPPASGASSAAQSPASSVRSSGAASTASASSRASSLAPLVIPKPKADAKEVYDSLSTNVKHKDRFKFPPIPTAGEQELKGIQIIESKTKQPINDLTLAIKANATVTLNGTKDSIANNAKEVAEALFAAAEAAGLKGQVLHITGDHNDPKTLQAIYAQGFFEERAAIAVNNDAEKAAVIALINEATTGEELDKITAFVRPKNSTVGFAIGQVIAQKEQALGISRIGVAGTGASAAARGPAAAAPFAATAVGAAAPTKGQALRASWQAQAAAAAQTAQQPAGAQAGSSGPAGPGGT